MSKRLDPETGLEILEKLPGETITYTMNMAPRIRYDVINTLTSVTAAARGKISGSTALTVSGETHDSVSTVTFKLAGGTENEDYLIETTIVTANGDTIIGQGILAVRNPS